MHLRPIISSHFILKISEEANAQVVFIQFFFQHSHLVVEFPQIDILDAI